MKKQKTLINVDMQIWAEVKKFATLNEMSLNEATNYLLGIALLDKDK